MMINFLLKLSDNDKRIIIILLAVFIAVLILIAYIGYIIKRVMEHQGKKINQYVSDVIFAGVITNEKEFKKYAYRKNWRVFYSQAKVPALLVVVTIIFYIIASSIQRKFVNPFNHVNGFGSLLFVWDFSTIFTTPKEGAGVLVNWPKLINRPHIVDEAWISYIFVPLILVGGLWYIYCVQGFIGRFLQINKLSRKIFLEGVEHYIASGQFINNQQAQQNSPVINNIDELEK